jgi:hypothetical protein
VQKKTRRLEQLHLGPGSRCPSSWVALDNMRTPCNYQETQQNAHTKGLHLPSLFSSSSSSSSSSPSLIIPPPHPSSIWIPDPYWVTTKTHLTTIGTTFASSAFANIKSTIKDTPIVGRTEEERRKECTMRRATEKRYASYVS